MGVVGLVTCRCGQTNWVGAVRLGQANFGGGEVVGMGRPGRCGHANWVRRGHANYGRGHSHQVGMVVLTGECGHITR